VTSAAPTLVALETDSAWVVILAVSLFTLPVVLLVRRLIKRPGGLASGLLLILPLVLPLVAALVYQHAILPEISILEPARSAFSDGSGRLLHVLLVGDGEGRLVTPYALTGSAGPYLVVFGIVVSSVMLLRRVAGQIMLVRLRRRCEEPDPVLHATALAQVKELASKAGLKKVPELLLLPPGTVGAFAIGGGGGRILISEALIADLDEDETEAILAHEIAHLEAKDVRMVALAGTLRDVVAWNPIAHIAYRSFASQREYEADTRAASLVGNPLSVASGLIKMCDLIRVAGRIPRSSLAFIGRGRKVKRRVSALLALADSHSPSVSVGAAPYVMAAMLVAVLGLQVGARIAEDGGALAIMWGGPDVSETRTWGAAFRNPARNAKSMAAKGEGTKTRARRWAPPPDDVALSFRSADLRPFLDEIRRQALYDARGSLGASGHYRNWEAVPLVAEGDGIGLYRINQVR
jgi:Zn-dependent protease with chaperone function